MGNLEKPRRDRHGVGTWVVEPEDGEAADRRPIGGEDRVRPFGCGVAEDLLERDPVLVIGAESLVVLVEDCRRAGGQL